MNREYINPPDMAPPASGLYSHVVKAGSTVYISGQVPRGVDGKPAHAGDAEAQMRLVWANLGKAITAAGGSLKDLVKTTVYVVGTDTLPAIRRARLDLLSAEGRPTSTIVVVAALADPSFLVEVDAIAVLGGD